MTKPAFCICDKQRLRSVAQRLCFHYTDTTVPLLPKWGGLAQWLASWTMDQGVPGSRPGHGVLSSERSGDFRKCSERPKKNSWFEHRPTGYTMNQIWILNNCLRPMKYDSVEQVS